ncbi:MAG: FAD-dependent thymidylate synthase [Candidatus Paceibacterota bacterium]
MKEIIIVDDLPVETLAMLQALYSRSPRSVREHLEQVKKVGPGKFMASFYVGYGHKSIGDCGTTSIFIENVSMLVAKAIQDWLLYKGQEASTRYLDMTKQPIVNPLGTEQGKKVQDEWMSFYAYLLEQLIPILKERFPREEGQDEKIWTKAVNARAFDIARSFLPAGTATFLSWHTDIRQANDHIKELRHHPLQEVREIAQGMLAALREKYPNSFSHKEYPAEESYLEETAKEITYFDDPSIIRFDFRPKFDLQGLLKFEKLLASRPAKSELHRLFRMYGDITFIFPLDFGSFRDIQRQRSVIQQMPLLTTKYGFHHWYLEQLPENLRLEAESFINRQKRKIAELDTTPEIAQYYTAMGFIVTCKLVATLPAAVYIAELRTSDAVHPTLRAIAQKMGEALKASVPGIAIHHDMSSGSWNINRGKQDIVQK